MVRYVRGPRIALAIAVAASSLMALLPVGVQASEYGPPGLNGARIELSDDGYSSHWSVEISTFPTVTGEGFAPDDLAQIFECPEGATDLKTDCIPLATAQTTSTGAFQSTNVVVHEYFTTASRGTEPVFCLGLANGTQCSVVAATLDAATLQPNAQAEHYICWEGPASGNSCKPKPTGGSGSTTTSTTTSTSTTSSSTTSSTSTSTSSSTTTTTTTLPADPKCRLREHAYEDEPQGTPTQDPTVGPTGGSSHDLVWQEQHLLGASPPPREGHAMAYEPNTGQTVLFGGFLRDATSNCLLSDTWTWDGTGWTKQTPAHSPPPLYGHVMAFDGTGIVLFGGHDGNADSHQTWTWDGTDWTPASPGEHPSARARAAMAYDGGDLEDPEDDVAVLFGGDHVADGEGEVLGDTWTWDGRARKWTQHSPINSPLPRAYAAMASHPIHGVVLHGGWNGDVLFGTFVWDGITWRQTNGGGDADSNESSPLTHSGAMAYHPATGVVVLQAGSGWRVADAPQPVGNGSPGYDGLWDGTGWSRLRVPDNGGAGFGVVANPPHRSFPAMAQDAAGKLVFFGGYGDLGTADKARTPETNPDTTCASDIESSLPDAACIPNYPYFTRNADRGDTWLLSTPGTTVNPPSIDPHERLTVEISPYEVPADGSTTASVTATVTRNGVGAPGYPVTFSTDGDVGFSDASGTTDSSGKVTMTLTASRTPGIETITARSRRPVEVQGWTDLFLPPPSGSAKLSEAGVTLTLDPFSIPADGKSTSVATAAVFKAGLVDETVCFSTDGRVTFDSAGPDHCGTKTGANTWAISITSSTTPAIETITAWGKRSGLRASAELSVGGGQWFDRTSGAEGPSPGRENAAVAYDEASGLTVLFGGYYAATSRSTRPIEPAEVLGDTWVWDGSRWAQLTNAEGSPIPGPSAREGASMAYDAGSRRLILFGGHDGANYLGDTWAFDGTTRAWTELDPPASPSPRYVANMAADGTGIVLFSGTAGWAYDNPNGPTDPNGPGRLHDTWTWRDGTWTEEHPHAPPLPPTATPRLQFSSTTPIVMPLPPPPPGCPGVHCDPDRSSPYPSAIPVSGLSGTVATITVTLRDLEWAQSGPADVDVMLVPPDGKTAIMLMSDACGTDPVTEPITLTLDDAAPSRLASDAPCGSNRYRPTNAQTLECTPFHRPDFFPSPAPAGPSNGTLTDLRGIDPNGTWNLYVVDDCPDDTDLAGEAGRIGGGWTIEITTGGGAPPGPAPLASPPGRGRAAFAYDPMAGKAVLFGGTQEFQAHVNPVIGPTTADEPFQPLGDTWTWDPGTKRWAQEGMGTHPPARRSAAMAYDGRNRQLVLFGGSGTRLGRVADPQACPSGSTGHPRCLAGDSRLNDTWVWDGSAWAPQSPPVRPPGGYLAGMAPDSSGHLVLVLGLGPSGSTWIWDSKVRLRLQPGVLPADGASTTVATATVTGPNGQGVPGLAVRFGMEGDSTVSGVTDHGDGTYTAVATASSTGGIETLTVRTPFGSAAASLNEVEQSVCRPGDVLTSPGSWTQPGEVAPMPVPRNGLAAATGADGRIYTFGGDGHGNFFWGGVGDDVALTYDPCQNTWQKLPPLPGGARGGAAAVTGSDGRIYVIGGMRPIWISMDLVEVYTPGAGSTPGHWETITPLPLARNFPAAAVDRHGDIYVSGGMLATDAGFGQHPLDAVVFSSTTGRWAPTAPMSVARYALGSGVTPSGRVIASGGYASSAPPVSGPNDSEAFDPATGTWSAMAPMPRPHAFFGASSGSDGLVYAVGGGPGTTAAADKVDAYAECADRWLPVADMHYERVGHAVVLGPDGRIYALGGLAAPAAAEEPARRGQIGGSGAFAVSPAVEAYTPDPATTGALCPRVSVSDLTVAEDLVAPAIARFTVSLDRPPLVPTTVSYASVNGTALAGSDYTPVSGSTTFAPGEMSKTVEVGVSPDVLVEGDETFALRLSAPAAVAGMAKAEGTATIVDAPLPQLSIGGAIVAETFSSSVPAVFTVSLDEPARVPVGVDYAAVDGTARAGADYTPVAGRVEIPVGASSASVTVPVLGDTVAESTETFSVALSNPSGAVLASGRGDGSILDAVGGLSVGDASTGEGGTASFTVSLAGPVAGPVSVDFATLDGSASAGSDYTAASGTLRFEPGETSKTIPVSVADDDQVEETEKFGVVLANAVGAPLARASGTGTIVDDDVAEDDFDDDLEDDAPVPPSDPSGGSATGPAGPPASSGAAPALALPGAVAALAPPAPSSPTDAQPRAVVPPLQPPQAAPNPLTQAQAQQHAQQQSQTQAQQQVQQQAQQQMQQQAQAQASAQAGMMSERQREHQVEQAHAATRDASTQVNLASERRRPPLSPAPALAWFAALMAAGAALAFPRTMLQRSSHRVDCCNIARSDAYSGGRRRGVAQW